MRLAWQVYRCADNQLLIIGFYIRDDAVNRIRDVDETNLTV